MQHPDRTIAPGRGVALSSPFLTRSSRDGGHEDTMAQVSEVKVPDIGNYTNVPVIEVLVKPGDTVAKDQGLVTLESDKATMEVPSPVAGVVKELKVKLNDEVSEGTVVALIEAADAAASTKGVAAPAPEKAATPAASSPLPPAGEVAAQSAAGEGGAGKSESLGQAPPSPQPSPASGR